MKLRSRCLRAVGSPGPGSLRVYRFRVQTAFGWRGPGNRETFGWIGFRRTGTSSDETAQRRSRSAQAKRFPGSGLLRVNLSGRRQECSSEHGDGPRVRAPDALSRAAKQKPGATIPKKRHRHAGFPDVLISLMDPASMHLDASLIAGEGAKVNYI